MKGAQLDKTLQQLKQQLQTIKREIVNLTEQGCELAYVHIKKGTRKMYLRGPSSDNRTYTYVGVDKQKQLEALARIERYRACEALQRLEGETASRLDELTYQLKELGDDAREALAEAKDDLRSTMAGAARKEQLKAKQRAILGAAAGANVTRGRNGTRYEHAHTLAG